MIDETLPKAKVDDGTISPLGEKILKVLIVLIFVAIFIIFLQITTFYGVFVFFETRVRVLTGYDTFIVKGISFLLLALFFGTPFGGLIWSFLPFPQKNKKGKRFIFLAIIAVFCFILYFTSNGVYFNPNDGKPTRFYSVQPNGEYNFYSQEGYDPVTGDKLKPATKDAVSRHLSVVDKVNREVKIRNYFFIAVCIILSIISFKRFYTNNKKNIEDQKRRDNIYYNRRK